MTFTRRVLRSKQRILRSPIPNEDPAYVHFIFTYVYFITFISEIAITFGFKLSLSFLQTFFTNCWYRRNAKKCSFHNHANNWVCHITLITEYMRGHDHISIKNEMNASNESCLLYTGLERISALPFSLECSQNKVTSKEKSSGHLCWISVNCGLHK